MHQPNCRFNADANTGHGFAILLASVGALRPYGLRRRLTWALGFQNLSIHRLNRVEVAPTIMKKKHLSLLLISTLLTTITVATERPSQKKSKASLSTSIQAVKSWAPVAFDQNAEKLPPNYSGIDPEKFLIAFKSKVEGLKKGEFETTEEFTQRTANVDALLSPINTTDTYAFRIETITIKYEADAQNYLIGGGSYGYSCKETYSFGESKGWVTCKVSSISRKTDKYLGSNAYGASREVERIRGSDFALAIPKDSAVLNAALTKDRYLRGRYSFEERLAVPLAKAKELKERQLAVLLIGRVTGAKLVEGRGTLIKPEIDSPTDILIMEDAIPFDLVKAIYYVVETGEILGQKLYKAP